MGTGIHLSGEAWRYVCAIALVCVTVFFRRAIIHIALTLVVRILTTQRFRNVNIALREFEKRLLSPLSWVLCILSVLIGLGIISAQIQTLTTIVNMLLGVALLWTVHQFCEWLNIVIVRQQGWEHSQSKDDTGKIMIVTEGIVILKYALSLLILYSLFFNQLNFDTTEIFTTIVLAMEVLFVLSTHSWFRNVMGGLVLLIDEPIKSGTHVLVMGHEGVIEHMYLQFFTVRQYDQGLAFVPNSVVFSHTIDIRSKSIDIPFTLDIHFHHATPARRLREFMRNADRFLAQYVARAAAASSSAPSLAGIIDTSVTSSQPKAALTDLIRSHLAKKDSAQTALHAVRFWVALVGLFHVQVVFHLPPDRSFGHRVMEKRKVRPSFHGSEHDCVSMQLVLGITKLMHEMQMELHDPNLPTWDPSDVPPGTEPPASPPSTDDEHDVSLNTIDVATMINELPPPISTTSSTYSSTIRRRTNAPPSSSDRCD
ncbi:Aste57867_25406 [Aphanomyces stellatus]|uniref:Aste57867_25406 protein n=1 Tax=Aphanomyces stellatus TaxID=120398 RepID=A0A485LU18_9STRA|nr:hypothetical protein As57867_025327 [Aphanomyces stellatus]VFU02030.1 Aste57867_25406 [Aphanomyces stellatus]